MSTVILQHSQMSNDETRIADVDEVTINPSCVVLWLENGDSIIIPLHAVFRITNLLDEHE